MAAANEFRVRILEDGKIEVKSVGGFAGTVHKDADAFLDFMKGLTGDATPEVKKDLPSLADPQSQAQDHKQQQRL